MGYKTINVRPETYTRLLLYKHAGLSFDEILNEIMDIIPEDKFYRLVMKEHKERMKKIKAGEYVESDDLEKALRKV
jgi:predicted CopG family antitoxin